MKLIFNKYSTGVEEMQRFFSHIPGTLDFVDFEADLTLAQEEVGKYVGMAIVQKAVTHYWTDGYEVAALQSEPTEEEAALLVLDELVYRVQMAVCLFGYRDYAQNADATHTSTGRTARQDKDSDVLNLRLIESDDLALMRKCLKAIDRLIKYIDEQGFTEWISSDIYKQTRDLLIWNADLYEQYFPIDRNNRVFLMLVPMMRKAQLDHILPRVGQTVYDGILEKVVAMGRLSTGSGSGAGDGMTTEDRVLYDLMCYPIAEMAISEAYLKLPVQLFPENMVRQFWAPGNGAAALVMREKLIKDIEGKGLESLRKLENEVERRLAEEAGTPITDDTIVDIAERMDATNLFARV